MNTSKIRIAILASLVGILTIVSCSSDDNNSTDITQNQVVTDVQSGTWHITKFIDSGTDETNYFIGYNFTFNNSGVLNANNGVNNYDGIWSITDSNSSDGSYNDSQDNLEFNINFNLTNEFKELNDDWNFISQTETKIELIDISSGNGDTDYLTFERN